MNTKTQFARRGCKVKQVLNWEHFGDFAEIGFVSRNAELGRIIADFHYWDFNAPYQRDECWSEQAEKNLIQSIFRGIPIGPVHIVKKSNDEKNASFNLLDAKQRMTAILHFMQNKFSVSYNKEEYTWHDLKLDENRWLLRKFENYPVNVIEWACMPILSQRILFEIINQSATLNTAEKIYCPNFLTRCLFKYIYTNCFKELTSNVRGEIKRDKRFSGIFWTHRICCLIAGPELTDTFSVRPLDKSNLTKSARSLDDKMCSYFSDQIENFDSNKLITKEVIEELGFKDLVHNLKKLASALVNCLLTPNNLEKQENAIDIMDFMAFTSEKIQQKRITVSQLEDNLSVFFTFYQNFKKEKESQKNLARHTTDVASITARKQIFDGLFDALPIDLGFKNKDVTESQKANALMISDGKCPITGTYLTESRINFDHEPPKSKSSNFTVRATSAKGNNIKSNLTKENLKDLMES